MTETFWDFFDFTTFEWFVIFIAAVLQSLLLIFCWLYGKSAGYDHGWQDGSQAIVKTMMQLASIEERRLLIAIEQRAKTVRAGMQNKTR